MNRALLRDIVRRHVEDHAHLARSPNMVMHDRISWPLDAVGDRGALLEVVVELMGKCGMTDAPSWQEAANLKTPELPRLNKPGLPPNLAKRGPMRAPSRKRKQP